MTRHLIVVLGDQLDPLSAAFDGFDQEQDRVWMAEVEEESTHVWSHRVRIALFLSAMRHFRDGLRRRGIKVEYQELAPGTLGEHLARALLAWRPKRVIVVEPGDYRVAEQLRTAVGSTPYEIRPDRSFFCSIDEFREYAKGRSSLRLEYFYRDLRRAHKILMDGREPLGGQWNFDHDNRGSFGKQGPGLVVPPRAFPPDAVTQEVLVFVARRFPNHPGDLTHFNWAVTPEDALLALEDFLDHRLPVFGQYQDAMWMQEPYLYHSRLSSAMNLKLLSPRIVVESAEAAYHAGRAPLAAVEGFIRQILGWREYVRGIYWTYMPEYAERNALDAFTPLPSFYWTAETEMNCLRQSIGQTLEYGYAHHIQRLMVTGLYALLLGVRPREIHEWYLAVYVDAVEWVEMPNVLGMSQFADGGLMGSKPYVATGKYIQRMSNYCQGCRFNPAEATGEDACPFTTLYWDFLMRHADRLQQNGRMDFQLRHLVKLPAGQKLLIREQADALRGEITSAPAIAQSQQAG